MPKLGLHRQSVVTGLLQEECVDVMNCSEAVCSHKRFHKTHAKKAKQKRKFKQKTLTDKILQ